MFVLDGLKMVVLVNEVMGRLFGMIFENVGVDGDGMVFVVDIFCGKILV